MAKTFPRVLVMVVCDDIQPREERVYDLFGVRTEIRASTFPHVQTIFSVYGQVSGHEGTVSCHLEIIQAGEEHPLQITPEQEVHLAGPLVPMPLQWWIESCTFPAPGLYYIQIYFGTRLAGERRTASCPFRRARGGSWQRRTLKARQPNE
jgi:hypothetical protein